jgi:hypothetical protein
MRGTLGQGAQRLPAGTELVAHIAMLTAEDGSIREHETFECEPLAADREAATP